MVVLISNENQSIISEILPKVKFQESTTNTSTFEVGEKGLQKICKEIQIKGFNPYALLTW